jgi:hypothetical protein
MPALEEWCGVGGREDGDGEKNASSVLGARYDCSVHIKSTMWYLHLVRSSVRGVA